MPNADISRVQKLDFQEEVGLKPVLIISESRSDERGKTVWAKLSRWNVDYADWKKWFLFASSWKVVLGQIL